MTDQALLARLDTLESRVAIERLINSYAQGFDSRDPALVRSLWFEDSKLLMGAFGEYEGLEAIVQAADGFWGQIRHMHHWMANPIIDVDGDKATSRAALDCFVIDNDDGPTQIGGLYTDTFERRNGRWGIVVRRFELHYQTPLSGWESKQGTDS